MVLYTGFILYISMCRVSEDGFITVAILVSFKCTALSPVFIASIRGSGIICCRTKIRGSGAFKSAGIMKIDMKKYRKAQIVWGGVTIKSAGRQSKEMPLTTKKVSDHTFVLIKTREPWLNNAIFGTCGYRCGNWSLLEQLRRHVVTMEKRIRSGLEAIVQESDDDDDDPMNAMGPCGAEDPGATENNHQVPHRRKEAFIPQVITVQMHEWPPEADVGCSEGMREVRLFLEGNQKLWIHWEDIEWLVRSLWVNCQLKGVPNVPGEDKGPGADKTIAPSQCGSE